MTMSLKDSIMHYAHGMGSIAVEAAQNPKIAHGSALATIGTGSATVASWIPANIGTIASLFGMILTATLFVVNIRKEKRDAELFELEKERLRLQIKRYEDTE